MRLTTQSRLARQISARDTLRTYLLLAGLIAVSWTVLYLLFGAWGLVFGTIGVAATSMLGSSGELFLRLQRGQELSRHSAPTLVTMVEMLAHRAGIPTPAVYLIPTGTANALATETSDERGAVAVTHGLLRLMHPAELQAVLAHELSHLKHQDTRLTRLVSVASRVTTSLLPLSVWFGLGWLVLTGEGFARWTLLLALSFLTPFALKFFQSALARTREFAADTGAALLTGDPRALASALTKLEMQQGHWLDRWVRGNRVPSWLSSHPSTHERIQRLKAMARATVQPQSVFPPRALGGF